MFCSRRCPSTPPGRREGEQPLEVPCHQQGVSSSFSAHALLRPSKTLPCDRFGFVNNWLRLRSVLSPACPNPILIFMQSLFIPLLILILLIPIDCSVQHWTHVRSSCNMPIWCVWCPSHKQLTWQTELVKTSFIFFQECNISSWFPGINFTRPTSILKYYIIKFTSICKKLQVNIFKSHWLSGKYIGVEVGGITLNETYKIMFKTPWVFQECN